MNCEKYKVQIEEQLGREALPVDVVRHVETCRDCRAFNGECAKLREMLNRLEAVNAPNDFNFRLKGRMKRTEKPVTVWGWQRLAGAGTATLAALAVGFVVLNSSSVPTNTADISNPVQSANTQQTTVAVVPPAQTPERSVIEDKKETNQPVEVKPQIAQQVTRIGRVRKAQPKNADEEIFSRDSVVTYEKQETPRGIPNPLEAPKKQDAAEILRTLGVETEATADGLRVTKSNRNDLKTGDVIQKVNDENPAAVSGTVLNEIRLTVRRQDQTKEVKILAKP